MRELNERDANALMSESIPPRCPPCSGNCAQGDFCPQRVLTREMDAIDRQQRAWVFRVIGVITLLFFTGLLVAVMRACA